MENMGDVTYDNPVYEFDPDDQLDNPSDRLVHLPSPLTTSAARDENVSSIVIYYLCLWSSGHDREFQKSSSEATCFVIEAVKGHHFKWKIVLRKKYF